ncbi:sensor histidine kinase [Nonomuraea sp. NPDC050394]|uniref:sensor histidine kinase n=1 Tax=Nonomuraea sp. NPDC050394 TaxID=3364363 RepID=UPI0037A87934
MVKEWQGWALVVCYVGLLIPTRFSRFMAAAEMTGRSSPLTLVMGLGLIMVIPLLFVVAARGRRWALPLLAVATFGPYLPFPGLWGPIAGPLAAAAPLSLAGPLGWSLFAAVIVGDALLRPSAIASSAVIDVNMGLTLFALVRLAVLLSQTHAANRQLADLEVTHERLRAADDLRNVLGAGLTRVLRLSGQAPTAGTFTEIARISREAAAQARTVADARREPVPVRRHDPPDELTALARWFTAAMALCVSVIVLSNVAGMGDADRSDWAVTLLAAPLAVALQLYHGAPRASAPRAWRWTLPSHILVMGAAAFYVGDGTLTPLLSMAVANTLLWLPARWSVPIVVAGAVGIGQSLRLYPEVAGYQLYQTTSALAIAISVFAFNRLPAAAAHLRGLRRQIARTAVITERLRVARDVHDLLGSTLSGITLKAELAQRAIDHDAEHAARLLQEIGPLAVRALTDVGSITAERAKLALHAEIESARELLASAGVEARVHTAGVEEAPVLAWVLREAVTNVVRHSAARLCTITLDVHADEVRLRVTNDGVAAAVPGTGRGLANLAARVEAAGGTFTAGAQGDETFALTASVPG